MSENIPAIPNIPKIPAIPNISSLKTNSILFNKDYTLLNIKVSFSNTKKHTIFQEIYNKKTNILNKEEVKDIILKPKVNISNNSYNTNNQKNNNSINISLLPLLPFNKLAILTNALIKLSKTSKSNEILLFNLQSMLDGKLNKESMMLNLLISETKDIIKSIDIKNLELMYTKGLYDEDFISSVNSIMPNYNDLSRINELVLKETESYINLAYNDITSKWLINIASNFKIKEIINSLNIVHTYKDLIKDINNWIEIFKNINKKIKYSRFLRLLMKCIYETIKIFSINDISNKAVVFEMHTSINQVITYKNSKKLISLMLKKINHIITLEDSFSDISIYKNIESLISFFNFISKIPLEFKLIEENIDSLFKLISNDNILHNLNIVLFENAKNNINNTIIGIKEIIAERNIMLDYFGYEYTFYKNLEFYDLYTFKNIKSEENNWNLLVKIYEALLTLLRMSKLVFKEEFFRSKDDSLHDSFYAEESNYNTENVSNDINNFNSIVNTKNKFNNICNTTNVITNSTSTIENLELKTQNNKNNKNCTNNNQVVNVTNNINKINNIVEEVVVELDDYKVSNCELDNKMFKQVDASQLVKRLNCINIASINKTKLNSKYINYKNNNKETFRATNKKMYCNENEITCNNNLNLKSNNIKKLENINLINNEKQDKKLILKKYNI